MKNAAEQARFEAALTADTIAFAEEADEPVSAWSLEEFDEFAELASRRAAWDGADYRHA